MPTWSAEDIADFVSSGVQALFSHAGGPTSTVKGIFLDPFQVAELLGIALEDAKPQFTCATDDISSAEQGDSLIIMGTTYYIIENEPEGTGMSTLMLSLTSP